VFSQFSTGGTGEVMLEITGQRNVFDGVDLLGPASTAAIQAAGMRIVKFSAGGENTFRNCHIGVDTVTRSAANASLEFAGGTARNTFIDCVFPMFTDDAGALWILGTGAACMDRWQLFKNCMFLNSVESTSTTLTVGASLTSASSGGMLVFNTCGAVGMTKWGDANALAQSYVSNVGGAATDGLMLAPS